MHAVSMKFVENRDPTCETVNMIGVSILVWRAYTQSKQPGDA
jgi:hypothetical protein